MKHIIFFISLFSLLMLPVSAISALPEAENITLKTLSEDMNGDQITDHIELKGFPLPGDSNFIHDMTLNISNKNTEHAVFLGNGYDPEVRFIHLNEDNAPFLFFQMKSSSAQNAASVSYLYKMADGKLNKIELPELNYLKADIKEPFTIEVKSTPNGQSLKSDLSELTNKKELFTSTGNLAEGRSLKIGDHTEYKTISLGNKPDLIMEGRTPITTSSEKGILIGHVKTLWMYKDDKWSNVFTTWITADDTN